MTVAALVRGFSAMALSISRLTIRPPGPLPCSELRSMPASAAMRAAIGEINCRPSVS